MDVTVACAESLQRLSEKSSSLDETGDACIEGKVQSPDSSHAQALENVCVEIETHDSSFGINFGVGFVDDSFVVLRTEDTAASEGVGFRTRGKRTETSVKVLSGEVHGALRDLASRAII